MAIQKINLGTEPLGEGGDTYRSANTKINENFSNTAHAASRLVGTGSGELAESTANGVAGTGWGGMRASSRIPTQLTSGVSRLESDDKLVPLLRSCGSGIYRFEGYTSGLFTNESLLFPHSPLIFASATDTFFTIQSDIDGTKLRVMQGNSTRYNNPIIQNIYTDKNTRKDSKTNLLLGSGDTIPNNSAASRLVGDANGNVAEVKASGYASSGFGGFTSADNLDLGGVDQESKDAARLEQLYRSGKSQIWSSSKRYFGTPFEPNFFMRSGTTCANIQVNRITGTINVSYGFESSRFEYKGTAKVYTDKNTILDGGYLKPSSPVLRLGHDDFVKEHEAEYLDIKVDNPEKGVYKITGTTGLRNDGTWYFSPPKDEHLNVLCMVEIEEEGEVITVKTYAKKFDFEKVAIVPDYENPVDIVGEVLLRFNDLPEEQLGEPEPEEEPIVYEEVEQEVVEEPTEEPSEESE